MAHQVCHDLLVGGGQAVFVVVAVLEAEQFLAVMIPAAGFLPQPGGLHRGHDYLLGPGPVHLLADYFFHLAQHPIPHGQPGVDARGQLADKARAQHKLVAYYFGLGRGFLQGGYKTLAELHLASFFWKSSVNASRPKAAWFVSSVNRLRRPGIPVRPGAPLP